MHARQHRMSKLHAVPACLAACLHACTHGRLPACVGAAQCLPPGCTGACLPARRNTGRAAEESAALAAVKGLAAEGRLLRDKLDELLEELRSK